MKRIFLVLLIACQSAFAQKEAVDFKSQQLKNKAFLANELKDTFATTDFSALFTKTENESVLGFIGDNYQRIRIKFISVVKDKNASDTYAVYGKSMVKTNIDQFHGTIKITNIRKKKVMSYGIDDEYKSKGLKGQFVIIGDYFFSEPGSEKHSGIFKGVFKSKFYLDKRNHVQYDEIELGDSYTNNQFVGQWKSYDGKFTKRCNWGDYRIPNSGDLDIGAGDFSPAEKYKKNGWRNVSSEKVKWWL